MKKRMATLLHSRCHRRSGVFDTPLSLDLILLDHGQWLQGRDRLRASAAMPCPECVGCLRQARVCMLEEAPSGAICDMSWVACTAQCYRNISRRQQQTLCNRSGMERSGATLEKNLNKCAGRCDTRRMYRRAGSGVCTVRCRFVWSAPTWPIAANPASPRPLGALAKGTRLNSWRCSLRTS